MNDFGGDDRFHLVAIPWSPALEPFYAPARVVASDRPKLVPANDSVETVAAPMALVAIDAPQGSPRADALGRVARAFFDSYGPRSRPTAIRIGATSTSRRTPRSPTRTGRG